MKLNVNVKELIAMLKANTVPVTVEFIVDALTKCEAVIARLRARNNALHKAIGDAGITVKSKLKDGKWSWSVKLPQVQPTLRDGSIASLLRALSEEGIHATPTGMRNDTLQWEVASMFHGANYRTAYNAAINQNKEFERQIKRDDLFVQKLGVTLKKAGIKVVPHVVGSSIEGLTFNIINHRADKLQKFKNYVHMRLDAANIPINPDGPHSKEGCRVGDRLDIALAKPIRLTPIADGIKVVTQRTWMCDPQEYDVKVGTPGYDLIYRLYSDTVPAPAKA